jgi:hypothetical protein
MSAIQSRTSKLNIFVILSHANVMAMPTFCHVPHPPYRDTGITNSAPLPMLSGQRCMMDFCRV